MVRSHVLIVIWGTLEIIMFGGIIFGWASLVFIFKLEHYFEDYCHKNITKDVYFTNLTSLYQDSSIYNTSATDYTTTSDGLNRRKTSDVPVCDPQDRLFNLIYVLAVVINGVSTFFNGVLWDKLGTRFLRCVGIVLYCLGLVMLAFSSPNTAMILFPSMILVAYGGYIVLMTNLQLGNLIPSKRSMIISLYCGAYDSSAFMLILVKWAYTAGLLHRYSFLILLGLFSTVILSTFWFMPSKRIPFPLPEGYQARFSCKSPTPDTSGARESLQIKADSKDTGDGKAESVETDGTLLVTEDKAKKAKASSSNSKPFLKEMMSILFMWDMVWLTLMRFQSWSFVGRLNPALVRLAGGDQDIVSQYTSVYAILQFFGVFFAPLSGRLMDRKKSKTADPELKRIETIEVCIASFLIDNTFGLLLAITMTIPILEVQYVSFVFHVLHRSLLYGPNSAFIAQAFSAQNFGKLFGLAMTVSAFVSLLQFPLFIMVQGPLNGDPFVFNVLVLVLMVLAYGHPIYLTVWCRRRRRRYTQALALSDTKASSAL